MSQQEFKSIFVKNLKLKDKILLITGGTGSFGTAVLNRFLHTEHFKEIRIFSRDEKKQDDMRNLYKSNKLKFYIGDVRDFNSVDYAMRGVDYVFHAAAVSYTHLDVYKRQFQLCYCYTYRNDRIRNSEK